MKTLISHGKCNDNFYNDYNDIWHACLWGNDSLFSLLQQHSVLISMHVKLYEVFMKQHLPQVISKL